MSKFLNFYCVVGSPSARAVIYAAEQLNINLKTINININSTSEEYLEINPARVAMLDDDGTLIHESNTIMIYLVEKYGETDDLYPKDLTRRARVNSMLFFETQFLFGRLRAAVDPFFETFSPQNPVGVYLFGKVTDSLERLERILMYNGTDFIAANSITICDFACISTIVSIDTFQKFDEDKFPMIVQWRNRLFAKFPGMERIETQNAHDFKILLQEIIEMRKLMESDETNAN